MPNQPSLRVVSLLPSATEIVCALGAGSNLVGISHECDFPSAIRDRPILTKSRIAVDASSRDIDTAVRTVIRDALSIYSVDSELLGALSPDVIVTQDLCEVCAVSLDDVRAAVARIAHSDGVEIVSLRPTLLGDVFDDIHRVAAALNLEEVGRQVRADLEARVQLIKARAQAAVAKPRVLSIEWIDPLMLGGTWMPEIIEAAGGIASGATSGFPAPTVSTETLLSLKPDVVVIKPCGFSMERALEERELIERFILRPLDATARVYVTDGNAFFNRPGPRLVESIEIMAACVHPDLFDDFRVKHARDIMRLDRDD